VSVVFAALSFLSGAGADSGAAALGAGLGLVRGVVVALARTDAGTRVVQSVVALAAASRSGSAAAALMAEVAPALHELVACKHGNHVLSCCVTSLPPAGRSLIVQWATADALSVACSEYGCRVVQRIVDSCGAAEVSSLLRQLSASAYRLVRSPWGQYVGPRLIARFAFVLEGPTVVPDKDCKGFALDRADPEEAALALEGLERAAASLSAHAPTLAQSRAGSKLLEHLLRPGLPGVAECLAPRLTERAVLLASDQLGNYVVQTMLATLPEPWRGDLVGVLSANRERLVASGAMHVVRRLDDHQAAARAAAHGAASRRAADAAGPGGPGGLPAVLTASGPRHGAGGMTTLAVPVGAFPASWRGGDGTGASALAVRPGGSSSGSGSSGSGSGSGPRPSGRQQPAKESAAAEAISSSVLPLEKSPIDSPARAEEARDTASAIGAEQTASAPASCRVSPRGSRRNLIAAVMSGDARTHHGTASGCRNPSYSDSQPSPPSSPPARDAGRASAAADAGPSFEAPASREASKPRVNRTASAVGSLPALLSYEPVASYSNLY